MDEMRDTQENEFLAGRFEEHRGHLRSVAYRMLGSTSEAEDAVQEAWLRLDRSGAHGVDNLGGWLTTVVARVCLDLLRSRRTRREEPLDQDGRGEEALPAGAAATAFAGRADAADPEQQALLADSVGLALLVVLDTLAPAERLAFVLHDMFAVPFDEIAPIVDRTPAAARQLASRARRRIQGAEPEAAAETDTDTGGAVRTGVGAAASRKRAVVEAWVAASRGGDFEALLALLDPDVVLRVELAAPGTGLFSTTVVHGAQEVVRRALSHATVAHRPALINGAFGIVSGERGTVQAAMMFTLHDDGLIGALTILTDPAHVARLEFAELD
ncbi:MAG TPA: sigma-70 family RNA polymerase sigma factor [Actinocrinis sp.]|nr:sigma-70 family RNA polymerase sigma factor [Actinocrinis sp.]